MMPSACTKGEHKASLEAPEPLKQAINVVDKKVRNLEKRKGKLDAYKVKYAGGETLNKDQQEAIEKYEGVVSQLEFARELQKQLIGMQGDVDKQTRKYLKKEKIERQAQETRRVKELLQVQNILEYFGEDSIKADFQNASKGAVQLTEEDLNKLELLYKLICPTREGDVSYDEQLNQAAEHISNFLEGKEKEVETTTYKDLKELTDKIIGCGYFEHMNSEDPAEQEEETQSGTEEPAEEEFPDKPEELTIETEDSAPLEEVEQLSPEAEFVDALEESPPRLAAVPAQLEPSCEEDDEPEEPTNPEDDSFFTTVPFPRQRPFQEIVSSVQGDFNFLQDSEIETDYTGGLPPQSYQSAAAGLMNSDEQYASLQQQQQHTQQQPSPTSGEHPSSTSQPPMSDSSRSAAETQQQQQFGDLPSQSAQSASGLVPQQTGLESTYSSEQSYSQNLMSQTLGGATQHTYNELAQQMATPGGIDQAVGAPSDVPQPIPLPSQTLPGQSLTEQTFGASAASQPVYGTTDSAASGFGASDSAQTGFGMSDNNQSGFSNAETSAVTAAVGGAQVGTDTQEKKEYSMNPEADVFRSMYSQPTSSFAQQSSGMTHAQAAMSGHDGKTFSQTAMQSEFQGGSNFGGSGNYNHQRNGPPRSGNNRGRGGRGNSFNRGGRGGSYGGGRGNYTNGGGRGSRGGGGYQGFPARSDYRSDGYQGFNNNITSGFNGKRGAESRGGAVRGGNPRGGMRGGGNSRGSSGGYRPSSGHQHIQQTTQASA